MTATKCTVCGVPKPVERKSDASSTNSNGWTCHICTFINSSSTGSQQKQCEMCGTPQKAPQNISQITTRNISSQMITLPSSSSSPALSADSADGSGEDYIRLSFRGTGPSNFIAHLTMALQKQDWKVTPTDKQFDPLVIGVAGLLKRVDTTQKDADTNLSIAFTDLDSLMNKASEMVNLATSISTKLANKTETVDDSTERDFKNLLLELGISTAVTRETTGNLFHTELARQLSEFSSKLIDKRGTAILPLADIYCLYNRARGTNLVSPDDIYRSASLFKKLNLAMELTQLPTGLLVVQESSENEMSIMKRILSSLINEMDSLDALEVSMREGFALSIVLIYLRKAESMGLICRDESSFGTRYYQNIFLVKL
jgi:ESCRT-II complex subunit VPS36